MNLISKQKFQVDSKTLEALPVAVILLNSKEVLFLNKEAIKLINTELKAKPVFKKNGATNKLLLKGEFNKIRKQAEKNSDKAVVLKLSIKDLKGNNILVEAKTTKVPFQGKTVFQLIFSEIKSEKTESKEANELIKIISQKIFK